MVVLKTDVLVIGGGVAGLSAAIAASRYGTVTVLNKGCGETSNSVYAQGGVAVAMSETEQDIQAHCGDTIAAGAGLCRPDAVRVLVQEGPQRVRELITWGAKFDKEGDQFALAKEGAHGQRRVLRAQGDATGNEIVRTLWSKVSEHKEITVRNGYFAVRLHVFDEGRCQGLFALDEEKTQLVFFQAKGVILATGGAGWIYQRTTNPPVATGDGIALALHVGADVSDMEFFQFHPTALALSGAPSFLITEAMRGEGATLCNAEGKRFIADPGAELAPRDVVTRAIHREMSHGQRIFLDATHLPGSFIKKRFPTVYTTCLDLGIDMTRDRIPVAPSAHYLMGGVVSSLHGESSVSGLYVAGEVACTGAHGANRLASNSLLEGLVFGHRAGSAAGRSLPVPAGIAPKPSLIQREPTPESCLKIQEALRETMWLDVGVVRNARGLENALQKLRSWRWILEGPGASRLTLETQNMLWVSAAVVYAATMRRTSVGAHIREDSPNAPAELLSHVFDLKTLLRFLDLGS